MEVITKQVPGQENQGSFYYRNRSFHGQPLKAYNTNTWNKDIRQQIVQKQGGFKNFQANSKVNPRMNSQLNSQVNSKPPNHNSRPTNSTQRDYNSLPRMSANTSHNKAAVTVQSNPRFVSKVFVEIGNHEDGHGDKSVSRSSSFLKRKKTKDIDESGVQDDSVIYSESKSSKLSATKRPSRRIESFNIRRPKHNEAVLGDVHKKNNISSDLRRTSLNSSLNGSRIMDTDPAGNGVSPLNRHPPPAWASYSEGLNRYRNGGSQGPGRPTSPYDPPGTPQRGVSTSVVKNLAYQYSSSYHTPPSGGHRLYEAPSSEGQMTRMDNRQGVHRTSSLTRQDLHRTGSVTSHELEDLLEKYRGEETHPDGWSISSLVTTPPPLPKTPPPPAPRSVQLSVMPPNPSVDTIVMPRSPNQVLVHTKPYYNTSTQTDDLPPSPPPPAYEYPSSQVSYRSIEVQCDMDRDLMHTTVTKMSTLERRRTLKSDVSTQINQALAVLRDHHQQQEFSQSTRGQQRPEPQVAAPVSQPTGQVPPSQPAPGQWQNPAKRFNIPESNYSDISTQPNPKQKQIQDDILDKISEHSPSQTYMLRKLSQEFFKTKPGYGYINRLQDRTGSESVRQGQSSDASRSGSYSNYEIYSEINGASHSRSSSQSDYGSRLSLPQQHSIGEDSGMFSARTEDSGMFSARTSMSEPSSQLGYHDRSQSQSSDKPPSFRASSPRQVRSPSQTDISGLRDAYNEPEPQRMGSSNYNQRTVHQSFGSKDSSVYVPSSYQAPSEKRQSVDHYENRNDQRVPKESYSDTDTNEADMSKHGLSKSYNIPRNKGSSEHFAKSGPEPQQSQGHQFSRGHKLSLKKAYGIFDPIDTTDRMSRSMNPQSRSKSTSNVPFKASFSNYVDINEVKPLPNEMHGVPAQNDAKSDWNQNDKNQEGSQRLKRTSSEQLRPVKERYKEQLKMDSESQRILPDVEMVEKGAWESQMKELNQVEMVPRGSDHDYSLSSGESSRRSTSSDHRMSAGSDVFGSSAPNPPSVISSHSSSSASSHEDRHRLSDPSAKKSTQQALLSFFERKTGKRLSTSSMESGCSADKTYSRDSLGSSGRHERSPSPLKMQDLDKSGEHKKPWSNRSPSPLKLQDLEQSSERMKKSKSLPRDLAEPQDNPAPAKKHPMHKWGELFLGKKSKDKSMASSASMDLGSLPSNERSMSHNSRNAGSMDGSWSPAATEDDRNALYSQPHGKGQEPEPMAPTRQVTKQNENEDKPNDSASGTSYQVTINKSYTEKDEEEDSSAPPVLPPRNYRSHSLGTGFKAPKPLPVTPPKSPKSPKAPKENFDQTPKPDKYADQLRAQLRKLNNSQSASLKPFPVPGKFLSTSRPVDRQPVAQEARAPSGSSDGKDDLSPSQLSPRQPQSPTSPAEPSRSPVNKSPRSPEVRPDHRPIQLTEPRPLVLSPRLAQSESVSEIMRKSEGYDPRKETRRPWSNDPKFSSSVSKQERQMRSVLPDKASKESLQLKSNSQSNNSQNSNSQESSRPSSLEGGSRFNSSTHLNQSGPSLPDLSTQMPRRMAAQKFQQLVHSTGVQETHFNATVVQTVGDTSVKQMDQTSPRNSREVLPGHERSLSSGSRDRLSQASNTSRDRLSQASSGSRDRLSLASSRDRMSQASNSSSIMDSREASLEVNDESNTDTMVKEPYRDAQDRNNQDRNSQDRNSQSRDGPLATSPRPRPILSSSDNFEEVLEVLEAEANNVSTESSKDNEQVFAQQAPLPKTQPPKIPTKKRVGQDERPPQPPQTSPPSRSPQPSSDQLSELSSSSRRYSSPSSSSSSLSVYKTESINSAKSLTELDTDELPPPPQKPPRRPRAQSREDISGRGDKSKASSGLSQDTPPNNRAMGDIKIQTPPAFPDLSSDKDSPRRKSPPTSPSSAGKIPALPTKMKYEPPVPEPSRPAPTLPKGPLKVRSQTDFGKQQEINAKATKSAPNLIQPQWNRSYDETTSKVASVSESVTSVPSEKFETITPTPSPQSNGSGQVEREVTKSVSPSVPSPQPEPVKTPSEPEKAWVPIVNHQRHKSQEEIEYELQAAIVVRHLSPEEKTLGEVILPSPEYKTTASYLRKVYQVTRNPTRTNQATTDKSSHLDMSSKIENIETLKKDLKERIEEKLDTLRTELNSIKTADKTNNTKGKAITGQILQDNKGAAWLEKFKSVADDTDSILKLLSNISARLARTENQMLSSSRMDEEKVELIDKKEALEEKWGDAKMLKEAIDRRYSQVRTSLTPEEREAFQEYLEYKIVYAMEQKEVEELLELGQDQLTALKSSLQDHS